MQLADYLRNKRTDTYVRSVFGTQPNGQHNLDIFSDLITKLIAEMNSLISHMYMIDYHAISLRKMFDELTRFTLKVINSNIADRNIKPIEERMQNMQTEKAIVDVRCPSTSIDYIFDTFDHIFFSFFFRSQE
jgi:hypothetical protein